MNVSQKATPHYKRLKLQFSLLLFVVILDILAALTATKQHAHWLIIAALTVSVVTVSSNMLKKWGELEECSRKAVQYS